MISISLPAPRASPTLTITSKALALASPSKPLRILSSSADRCKAETPQTTITKPRGNLKTQTTVNPGKLIPSINKTEYILTYLSLELFGGGAGACL